MFFLILRTASCTAMEEEAEGRRVLLKQTYMVYVSFSVALFLTKFVGHLEGYKQTGSQ